MDIGDQVVFRVKYPIGKYEIGTIIEKRIITQYLLIKLVKNGQLALIKPDNVVEVIYQ